PLPRKVSIAEQQRGARKPQENFGFETANPQLAAGGQSCTVFGVGFAEHLLLSIPAPRCGAGIGDEILRFAGLRQSATRSKVPFSSGKVSAGDGELGPMAEEKALGTGVATRLAKIAESRLV